MPQVTVYVREEDLDKWKSLNKKSEFLHNALTYSPYDSAGNKYGELKKPKTVNMGDSRLTKIDERFLIKPNKGEETKGIKLCTHGFAKGNCTMKPKECPYSRYKNK